MLSAFLDRKVNTKLHVGTVVIRQAALLYIYNNNIIEDVSSEIV